MKKIFLLVFSIIMMGNMVMAQDSKTKTSQKKVNKTPEQTATAAPAGKMKKDGTPDKRYKENKKEEAAAAGPTKKDGTPDKRYKENKTTPKQK
jgi:hypothetical protein